MPRIRKLSSKKKRNRSYCVIYNFLMDPRKYKKAKQKAPKSQISPEERQTIISTLMNHDLSASLLKSRLQPSISTSQIQRLLSSEPNTL